jgi:hypothetical protein
MAKDQILFGTALALVSLVGLACESWLMQHTKKGQALARWFGDSNGRWVLRAVLAGFALLGTLLALDVVRPVQWK